MIRALVPCTLAKTERILSSPRLKSPKVLQVLVSAFKHEFGERGVELEAVRDAL